MPKSIMIINSNPEAAQKIAVNLSSPNTEIVYVFSMVEALKSFTQKEFCLIILDAAISAEDDHKLLAAIRKSKTIPILILSSQSCHVERLRVLQAGAHAYIGEPYSMEECLAQAQALMQLYCELKPQQEVCYTLAIGKDLVIDPLSRQALLNGKDLRLTRKEFDLLFCLASNPGQVFSREQLYNHVWEEHSAYNVDEVVKAQIKTLRQKLNMTGNEYIDGNKTYFRNGYIMFREDGNKNKICYLYNGDSYSSTLSNWYPDASGNQLTSIVAVSRNKTTGVEICRFSYNSSNYLTSITDFANRTTTYTYDGTKLSTITYPDGATAHYTYSEDGELLTMYDAEAKYGVEYEYEAGRVSGIKEYAANTNSGAQTYGTKIERHKGTLQQTYLRYDGDDRLFNTADDLVIRYAFDFLGRTINTVTLDSTETKVLGVSAASYTSHSTDEEIRGKNNRIEKDAAAGQHGINLLKSGGLENHDDYTGASSVWTKFENSSDNNNAVVKTGEIARNGTSALKTYVNTNVQSPDGIRKTGIYQTVDVPAGTYTFSAYANTQLATSFDPGGGVYLAVLGSGDDDDIVIATGDKLASKTVATIENGWQRIYVTTTLPAGTYRFAVIQQNAYGQIYYDDLQLEEGNAPSTVNLLQNAIFSSQAQEWEIEDMTIGTDSSNQSNPVLKAIGNPKATVQSSQTIPIGTPNSGANTYLLSGWAKASSTACTVNEMDYPEGNWERFFGLFAKCSYADVASDGTPSNKTEEFFYMPFNEDYTDWQYTTCIIAPKEKENREKTLLDITVTVAYDYNLNNAEFDNLSLRQEPCSTYTYDNNGNVTAVNATGNSGADFTFAAGSTRLTKSKSNANGTYDYSYNDTNNKNLVTKIKNDGVSMNISYNAMGNSTSTYLQNDSSSTLKIRSSAEYSSDGTQLLSETNNSGYKTKYTYNTQRQIATTEDAAGNMVHSTYTTTNDRLLSTYQTGLVSTDFAYTNGSLSSILRGGYIPNYSDKQYQIHTMGYDKFGNATTLQVGYRTLLTYDYGTANNNLRSVRYANNNTIGYEYDVLGRVVAESINGTVKYRYFYNSEGALVKKLDVATGKALNYEYDSLGRMIHSWQLDATGAIAQKTEHLYDTENRISSQSWQFVDEDYSESYVYDTDDGSLTTMNTADGNALSFTYDNLKRLSTRSNPIYSQQLGYRNIDSTTTTTQVSQIQYSKVGSNSLSAFTLGYTYNNLGNIATITGPTDYAATYSYDAQGQLTSESSAAGTWSYTYDTYGNITEARNGQYIVYEYKYEDLYGWKDLLTSFDSVPFTYDASGNPTTYQNNRTWNMQWSNGRQLTRAVSGNLEISYTYDVDGIRDSKTVDGITYHYITQNGQVMRQSWTDAGGSSHIIDFIYDSDSQPYAFVYDGTTYYYLLNLQGDVIRIVSDTGATVASYAYDAWGRMIYVKDDSGTITNSSTHIGNINPLRYRGYYYDTESELYYLQSRYYDPLVKRFVNADEPEMMGADSSFLGMNLFTYCGNNPVMSTDSDGRLSNGWKIAITVGILVAATAVIVATGGVASGPVMCAAISASQGAIVGAATGAASGAAMGAVTGAIEHRLTTGSWRGAGKAAVNGAAQGAIDGAFSGAISGAITGAMNPTACFVAGTAVATAAGYVAIETLKEGDLVWAWDEETGDVALKPVAQVFVNESSELIHLTVNGEEIITTPTHPFYVAQKGWFAAVSLRAGDILVLVNGEYVVVEQVQHEILEAPIKVYNFEVEDYHTYFVGEDGVLVHNACHGNSLNSKKKTDLYVLRDRDTHKVMKIGETTRGVKRYTQSFYRKNNVEMYIFDSGSKRAMHYQQHRLLKSYYARNGYLPKLNKSFW